MTTLQELRESLGRFPGRSPEYISKMLHDLPPCPTVDRTAHILSHVRGKDVLDIGSSGSLAERLREAAHRHWGIEHPSRNDGRPNMHWVDLDVYPHAIAQSWIKPSIAVVGEVLEHLSNPGTFLNSLHHSYPVTTIFSVPNAFSSVAQGWLRKGVENVNDDHVSWYSPKTLGNLLGRAGYRIVEWACYNGEAPWAEGWIVRCEP